jgi:HEAT repeat protein
MKTLCCWTTAALLGLAGAAATKAAAPPPLDRARVAALVKQLDHDSFRQRERADRALRGYGKLVVPALREELDRDPSLEVRHRLTRIIHDLCADEHIPDLVKQLGDPNEQVRAVADWEIRRYGKAAVPALKQELRGGLDRQCRQQVRQIIADLSKPKAR